MNLGNGIVYIHCWDAELVLLCQLIESEKEEIEMILNVRKKHFTYRCTPVMLSSTMPFIKLKVPLKRVNMTSVASPPSSRIWRKTLKEERQKNCSGSHHGRLPIRCKNTLLNAPPEIFLRLLSPSKNRYTGLGQRSSNSILQNPKASIYPSL